MAVFTLKLFPELQIFLPDPTFIFVLPANNTFQFWLVKVFQRWKQFEDYFTDILIECDLRMELKAKLEKGHPCEKCDKVYTERKALRRHKENIHDGKRYNCKLCKYETRYEFYLTNHMLSLIHI